MRKVTSDLLSLGLGLAMLVAAGGIVQAVASGLGAHPARRLAIGLALLGSSVVAFAARERLGRRLRAQPALVLVWAAAQLALAALDGLPRSSYFAYCLTSVGVAVVVGSASLWVWLCAALLDVGFAIIVLAQHSPASLQRSGDLGTAFGALWGPVGAAIILLSFGRIIKRPDALERSLAVVPEPPLQLTQKPPPWSRLTPLELAIVAGLTAHGSSKGIANATPWSAETIDDQIASAKEKTGARTRAQLAALTTHPQWPGASGNGA